MQKKDELVYDGWLKIYKRKIAERSFDILKVYDAVAALLVCEDAILLVKQFRPALEKEIWEIPAGVLDKKDLSEKETLAEEINEETGLTVEPEELKHLVSFIPQVGYNSAKVEIYYLHLSDKVYENIVVQDVDVVEARWFPIEEVGKMIERNEIVDVKTILAYYRYLLL